MLICPSCNTESPTGFHYCGACGKPLPLICPQCGLENPSDCETCAHCNAPVSPSGMELFEVAMEGERRFVVVIFADIAGFTRMAEILDPEESTQLVNRCLDELTKIAVEHGGRLVHYLGDGLMVVFGAPAAHEDDPERAVKAAIVMCDHIRQIKFDIQVPVISLHLGLACGQVVAAGVGSQGRKEYNVIGSAINLAARLEEASGLNQILVSQELAQITDHAFAYKPVVLPHLQGWDGEVHAYELLGRHTEAQQRRAGPAHSTLVGRQTELAQLWQAVYTLQANQGAIVSVIGEVGIGKSRLLHELHSQVEKADPGLRWLNAQTTETGETLRYGCMQSLLRNAIGAVGSDDAAHISKLLKEHLKTVSPKEADEVYPYLAHAMGLPLPPKTRDEFEWLNEETLLWQTGRMLQAWLRALARQQPVALVIEDAHWADPASISLIEQLFPLAEEIPLLIILSFRPETTCTGWRLRLTAHAALMAHYTEIWLQPLEEEEIQHLLQLILDTQNVPRNVVELVRNRAEGNPLFIEELVRSMMDRKALQQDARGRWSLPHNWQEITIPNTIQGILQARIDRLNRDPKRMIQLAACIGRDFNKDILIEIAPTIGVPQASILPSLAALEKAGLIQILTPSSQANQYRFKHVLIRDTIYRGLLRAARAQFHTAIACWYEEHTLTTAEPPYALLAYHYGQTDDANKQMDYYTKAGFQAAQGYANQNAHLFFTKALDLIEDPAERYKLLLERERVCNLIGDRDQQRADLEELLKLANGNVDDAQRAIVYNRLAIWHESWGEYLAAHAASQQGLEAAHRAGARSSEAESLHRIASASWRQGNFNQALESAQTALEVARSVNDSERESISLTTMGIVYRTLGNLDKARVCYQQALDIRRRLGDRREIAISLSQMGNVHYDLGAFSKALDYHQQALQLFEQVGDRRGQAWSLSGAGSVYLACGDYEAAHRYFSKALDLRKIVHDRRGEGVAYSDLGNVTLAKGDVTLASSLLRRIGAHAARPGRTPRRGTCAHLPGTGIGACRELRRGRIHPPTSACPAPRIGPAKSRH